VIKEISTTGLRQRLSEVFVEEIKEDEMNPVLVSDKRVYSLDHLLIDIHEEDRENLYLIHPRDYVEHWLKQAREEKEKHRNISPLQDILSGIIKDNKAEFDKDCEGMSAADIDFAREELHKKF
jgi:hypothetical protein